eukprot:TRINITY_DN38479_c0_g1_i1.p1 TRINITY_DN38479_c0_g1~~TRINITY_DN38479_c0_g1_i1.p1  ORF type:complete len:268 (-),score=66.74 TRINITY_DN38479_c0_g1_i1:335-1138(-)
MDVLSSGASTLARPLTCSLSQQRSASDVPEAWMGVRRQERRVQARTLITPFLGCQLSVEECSHGMVPEQATDGGCGRRRRRRQGLIVEAASQWVTVGAAVGLALGTASTGVVAGLFLASQVQKDAKADALRVVEEYERTSRPLPSTVEEARAELLETGRLQELPASRSRQKRPVRMEDAQEEEQRQALGGREGSEQGAEQEEGAGQEGERNGAAQLGQTRADSQEASAVPREEQRGGSGVEAPERQAVIAAAGAGRGALERASKRKG